MDKTSNKFTEVLNDTIDYFLLGDVELLRDYKVKNNLSNDLATEFTTNESGDNIVKEGILIPMSKIVNKPYTIIFNLSKNNSEFDDKENNLVFKNEGYILKIENRKVMLFTWWILNDFSNSKINQLMANSEKLNKPYMEIKNGWYDIEIYGGFTKQKSEDTYYFEPTLEFKFSLQNKKSAFKADINKSFELIRSN